jgi:hypothetical protein
MAKIDPQQVRDLQSPAPRDIKKIRVRLNERALESERADRARIIRSELARKLQDDVRSYLVEIAAENRVKLERNADAITFHEGARKLGVRITDDSFEVDDAAVGETDMLDRIIAFIHPNNEGP